MFKDNSYHSKCFTCDRCNKSLDDPKTGNKLFFTIQEQKLCKPCALIAKKAAFLEKERANQQTTSQFPVNASEKYQAGNGGKEEKNYHQQQQQQQQPADKPKTRR